MLSQQAIPMCNLEQMLAHLLSKKALILRVRLVSRLSYMMFQKFEIEEEFSIYYIGKMEIKI
jgi:hypothetical protein